MHQQQDVFGDPFRVQFQKAWNQIHCSAGRGALRELLLHDPTISPLHPSNRTRIVEAFGCAQLRLLIDLSVICAHNTCLQDDSCDEAFEILYQAYDLVSEYLRYQRDS